MLWCGVMIGGQIRALLTRLLALVLILLVVTSAAAVEQPSEPAKPKWILQKTPSDCGRAVLASLAARTDGDAEAAYRRIPDPQDKIQGYSIAEMIERAPALGFALSLAAPSGKTVAGQCAMRPAVAKHLADLGRSAAANKPVVVPVTLPPGIRHYLLLIGIRDGRFRLMDPASSDDRILGDSELAALMCDTAFLALTVTDMPPRRRPVRR